MSLLASVSLALLRLLPAEPAHIVTLRLLKSGLVPAGRPFHDPILASRLWGLDFPNPLGLAAGFDKNAEVPDAMLRQGLGFVEIGSVTPKPQPGNPRPRLFRLSEDRAVINRLGFNNLGLDAAAAKLAARRLRPGIVGANLGKNKDQPDALADFAAGVRRLAPLADYLVINISSPNTPGLRALQGREPLQDLIDGVMAELPSGKPLLLKIAPDLTPEDRQDIAEIALMSGLSGLIVSNTTIERPQSLASPRAKETGGLSGQPLFASSTALLADMYRLTEGRLPLIGVGGIGSAEQAYAKIRAGASLLQFYSALIYGGPALIGQITLGLAQLLKRDGFTSLTAAIGADHRG